MKVIFLDIDGVLNNHKWMENAESCGINRGSIFRLNWILEQTKAKLVISSAWRYMILKEAMTLEGFKYLLCTHGLNKNVEIIGTTRFDYDINDPTERGRQIKEYVEANNLKQYIAIDNDDFGITLAGIPLIKTNGSVGLTIQDAKDAVSLLGA